MRLRIKGCRGREWWEPIEAELSRKVRLKVFLHASLQPLHRYWPRNLRVASTMLSFNDTLYAWHLSCSRENWSSVLTVRVYYSHRFDDLRWIKKEKLNPSDASIEYGQMCMRGTNVYQCKRREREPRKISKANVLMPVCVGVWKAHAFFDTELNIEGYSTIVRSGMVDSSFLPCSPAFRYRPFRRSDYWNRRINATLCPSAFVFLR